METDSDDAIKSLPEIGCNVLLDEFPTVTNGMETDRVVSMHVEEGGYITRTQ